jgi:hypothetical protein
VLCYVEAEEPTGTSGWFPRVERNQVLEEKRYPGEPTVVELTVGLGQRPVVHLVYHRVQVRVEALYPLDGGLHQLTGMDLLGLDQFGQPHRLVTRVFDNVIRPPPHSNPGAVRVPASGVTNRETSRRLG